MIIGKNHQYEKYMMLLKHKVGNVYAIIGYIYVLQCKCIHIYSCTRSIHTYYICVASCYSYKRTYVENEKLNFILPWSGFNVLNKSNSKEKLLACTICHFGWDKYSLFCITNWETLMLTFWNIVLLIQISCRQKEKNK